MALNAALFTDKVGLSFKNETLLREAFTHRSFLNENPTPGMSHNERLEYLGDAVIELIVSGYLFKTFPEKDEGELTALRAALVNAQMLSRVAQELGMNEYLLLSRGESRSEGKARQYILANTFEAFCGALYLDGGIESAERFVAAYLLPYIREVIDKKLWVDAKSTFQEKAQEKEGITPTYHVISEEGPDHAKIFTVGVFVGDEKVAEGRGASKQEAEQDAARKGLSHKGWA